jgi:hypothetical protein
MRTNIRWPETEEINLIEAFILADQIHQWMTQHLGENITSGMSPLMLHRRIYEDAEDSWAASFDAILGDHDDEDGCVYWVDNADDYVYSATGACPEEAIYNAAMKVKEQIETARPERVKKGD